MQAITIAIGKKGIDYFTRNLMAGAALEALGKLRPENREGISVDDFRDFSVDYKEITISLLEGKLKGFSPTFVGVRQLKDEFEMELVAKDFEASFQWHERYLQCWNFNGEPIEELRQRKIDDFSLEVQSLSTKPTLSFKYDEKNRSYSIKVARVTTPRPSVTSKVPRDSIVNKQTSAGCFGRKCSEMTATSIAKINFSGPLKEIFKGVLKSIPASSKLTPDIAFSFEIGDSPMTFPKGQGIQIGATGVASYRGKAYSAEPKPKIQVPPVPDDAKHDHHLTVYVSDWAFNGLKWTYYKSGRLDLTLRPSDLPKKETLEADTYAKQFSAFEQYRGSDMTARIKPLAAPSTSFRAVYLFLDKVMNTLKAKLPPRTFGKLADIKNHGFVSLEDLRTKLTSLGVDKSHHQEIGRVAERRGMVTTQDLRFQIDIENGQKPAPNIIFDLKRADILTDLKLGIQGKKTQTLKFTFLNSYTKADFRSTTIPGFEVDHEKFATLIWPKVGEKRYAEAMRGLGKLGVPMPIMEGFQFRFAQAETRIEDGFVSISAQVRFVPKSLPRSVAKNLYLVTRTESGAYGAPRPLLADTA